MVLNKYDEILGAKNFDYFLPSLLDDIEIQDFLNNKFKNLDFKLITEGTHLYNQVYDCLDDYIYENALDFHEIEVDLNEDHESNDYNNYYFVIRGMKEIFFTDSADDDLRLFNSFDKAVKSIELNFNIKLDDKKNKVEIGSVKKRMTLDKAIANAIKIIKK